MKIPLHYYGDPILRTKSLPISEITEEIKELVKDMIDTMDANHGIGLAAVQVGRPIRLFVSRRLRASSPNNEELSKESYVYINPKIIDQSQEVEKFQEGCLSIPGLRLTVSRPSYVKILSTQLDGTAIIEELYGIDARVIFHENDHLNGVLFIDRVKQQDDLAPEAKNQLTQLKKQFCKTNKEKLLKRE